MTDGVPSPASVSAPGGLSVLIGRASTIDATRILDTLQALTKQMGLTTCEIIVADRCNDETSETIRDRFPGVTLIPCPARTPLPALLATALESATGDIVAVTEDHCVPTADWLAQIREAFADAPDHVAAIGGSIENGIGETVFDWANFFCEYGRFLPPVPEGEGGNVPGVNAAYRRSVLLDIDPARLRSGFWDHELHPYLAEKGMKMFSTNRVRVVHCKKFTFSSFCRQRYLYSRYFAGNRYRSDRRMVRFVAGFSAFLIPPVLLLRIMRQVLPKRLWTRRLLTATPILAVLLLVWSWGEVIGYWFGPGDSITRIE